MNETTFSSTSSAYRELFVLKEIPSTVEVRFSEMLTSEIETLNWFRTRFTKDLIELRFPFRLWFSGKCRVILVTAIIIRMRCLIEEPSCRILTPLHPEFSDYMVS